MMVLTQPVHGQDVLVSSPPQRLALGFPNGWFAVGFSHELPPAGVLACRLAGHDLVVFRAQSGVAAALDAYCTHLGAHLGYGGTVVDGCIQCPFHGFRFDTTGTCVATGSDHAKPPRAAKLRTWTLHEVNGVLLVYYDAEGRPPTWQVPVFSQEGRLPPMTGVWTVHSHPQETTENSCDLSHLVWTHGYQEVELLDDLTLDGPYLRVRLAMRRPATLIGRSKAGLRVEYAIEACGLGYSRVDVALPAYGVHTRLLVLSTPTQEGEVELRGAAMTERLARPQQIHPLLWLVPRGLLNRLIARHTFNGFVHDLQQDFPMWEHKRYVQPPALAAGDGLIGKYRTWARQFYANQPHTLQHRAERPCVSSGIDLPANNGAASKRREG